MLDARVVTLVGRSDQVSKHQMIWSASPAVSFWVYYSISNMNSEPLGTADRGIVAI